MEPIELKEHIEPIELKEPIENENLELIMEPIELKEPIESTELQKRIEQNAEAYDECTLIDDSVDIDDANSEAYDECKLLLPSPDELMEELTNGCTSIDDSVDIDGTHSEAYDEYKRRLLLPSSDELIEPTNVGNKVGNNLVDKVGDNVGGSTVGTEQRPHARRQKELSNSWRQKPWTSLTSSWHSALPNSSTPDEAGFATGTTFVDRLVGSLEGSGVDCETNVIVR
jgi:hypothetical protein